MVTGNLVLTAMVLAPLVVGASLMAGDRLGARPVGHRTAWLLSLAAAAIALMATIMAAITQPTLDRPWVPQLGMRLHLRIDGISGPLVVLAAAVTLLAVAISARQRPQGSPGLFYGSVLMVLGAALLAFAAADVLLFFIAFEIVLVPMWVLIDRYGDRAHAPRQAGWTFLLYTVFGSMLMLAGLLVLVGNAGTTDMSALAHGAARSLPFSTRLLAGVLLTAGLAVKVPLLGVHTWLPRAHTAAPTAGSMLLAAVLLKLGTYGFVRLVVLPLPEVWRDVAPVVGVLAVLGILVGGLVCLVERDLKRLVAWSSVAHMGFVMLALAAGTQAGLQAALYGNLAHGVISALLFAVVGVLKSRRGQVDLGEDVVGLRNTDPRLGLALVLGFAAAMGVPGLAGFWGEVLAVFAAFAPTMRPHALFMALGAAAAIGAVLAAAYSVRVLRVVWQGEVTPPVPGARVADPADDSRVADDDALTAVGATPASVAGEHAKPADVDTREPQLSGLELAVIAALCLATVALGVLPSFVMHVSAHDVAHLLGGQP